MFNVMANDPLPYRPIRIVDISPIRSSIRRKPAKPAGRRRAGGFGAVLVGSTLAIAALAALAASAGAAPAPAGAPGEFRLGPGHALPAAFALASKDAVADPASSTVEFRLGPGHAMPAGLAR